MKVILSEYAVRELEDAANYLELEVAGLGQKLLAEVRSALKRLVRHPHAWSIERGEIRKCLIHKFPYKILYSIEPDHIFVIAIAHQHRKPDYWIDRLEKK